MRENGFLTIFQELYICKHSWKIVRSPFAGMVVLQSMWKGPNHCFNFMESGSESATYVLQILSCQNEKNFLEKNLTYFNLTDSVLQMKN